MPLCYARAFLSAPDAIRVQKPPRRWISRGDFKPPTTCIQNRQPATRVGTLSVQGVSVETPLGSDWRVDIIRNPCSELLERLILVENKKLDVRIKVDLASKTYQAEFSGSEARLDEVLDRIQGSFKGEREIPSDVKRFAPFPTLPNCDVKADGVPTLVPLPSTAMAEATEVFEPTSTPISPPPPPAPPTE